MILIIYINGVLLYFKTILIILKSSLDAFSRDGYELAEMYTYAIRVKLPFRYCS